MREIIILTIVLLFFSGLVVSAQDRFSESKCVRRLTKELDPPYRLKRANAVKRCRTIALRIRTLSKQILGKWKLIGSKTQRETLEFFANGSVRRNWYNSATRESRSDIETWVIRNGWGEVGAETIEFNGGFGVQKIKISGATMTITTSGNNPRFDPTVERYKRISQKTNTISFASYIDPYLNRNYPGWKTVIPKSTKCAGGGNSKTFIKGDFNGDGKEDYVLKFIQRNNGYYIAFLRRNNTFRPIVLVNSTSYKVINSSMSLGKKGARYIVDYSTEIPRYGRLPNDSPYISSCLDPINLYYVYRNGRFSEYSRVFE